MVQITCSFGQAILISKSQEDLLIKRPLRDACLCMGELLAPPAPHFVFLITL